MLTWAIYQAGYDLEEFLFHNPVVEKWMEDLKKPTVKQLEKFAQKVHATSRKRISPSFASYVSQAVKENRLLYRDAYKMTGLN